ncbi:hypothetical protein [Candidatus Laterigemmans baculatus]|uniref:hypothetical protein n=1 Tax=Candidatus Laterigemmans baculatus TaxID=2770505 RepID=UPI0013D914E0|nr:hypothetical protein [Candidatus Laterigemmans baculatus]
MFDIHQNLSDEYGEWDEDAAEEYIEGLLEAFDDSREAKELSARETEFGWSRIFLEYGFSYRGETPPQMNRYSIEEIVFELFPRKVSTHADAAADIIAELRAFWSFLQREYKLANAATILEALDPKAEEELKAALGDSSNFGPAKSLVLMGREAGFDMSTQEGMAEFMQYYNANIAAQRAERTAAEKPLPPSRIDPPSPLGGLRDPGAPRVKRPLSVTHVSPDERRERNKKLRKLKGRKRK